MGRKELLGRIMQKVFGKYLGSGNLLSHHDQDTLLQEISLEIKTRCL